MARLTIRHLSARDLPAMRHVHQHVAEVSAPDSLPARHGTISHVVSAVLPRARSGGTVFVALIDDEVCAYAAIRSDRERFAWHIVGLAAGSPNLEAHDADVVELWSGLLEFTIARAGEAGAKRLFADCYEGSIAHASLSRAGFEGFATRATLLATHHVQPGIEMDFVRSQEPSDVWSIHHLYHQVTPRAVQFAEARTSTSWELPERSRWERMPMSGRSPLAVVYETTNGIEAYCRVERFGEQWRLELLIEPTSEVDVSHFVRVAAHRVNIPDHEKLYVRIPGYAIELITALQGAGFEVMDERIATVRHTTVPAAVHVRLAPLPAVEASERAVRGIPTYSAALGPGGMHAGWQRRWYRNPEFSRCGRSVNSDRLGRRGGVRRSE